MNKDILAIIRESAAMGAAEALRKMQPVSDRISQRQAIKEYGLGFVRMYSDRLTTRRIGNRIEYSRAEIEQLRASMTVAEMATRIENQLIKNA